MSIVFSKFDLFFAHFLLFFIKKLDKKSIQTPPTIQKNKKVIFFYTFYQKALDFFLTWWYNVLVFERPHYLETIYNSFDLQIKHQKLGIAQMVARYLGVVEAVGSNPATQTKNGGIRMDSSIFLFCGIWNREKIASAICPKDQTVRRTVCRLRPPRAEIPLLRPEEILNESPLLHFWGFSGISKRFFAYFRPFSIS